MTATVASGPPVMPAGGEPGHTTGTHSFVVAGYSVSSDMALPGLIRADPVAAGPADIVIHRGEVPNDLADATLRGPTWQMAPGRFLLDVLGIVRLLLIDGKRITYTLASGVTDDDAAIFVMGTGFGILLHQRGRVVLHASAVRVRDSAVLFCGPSGAGKSTLAAALGDAGYDLVTDDVCAVAIDANGVPWIAPDGRQLKLWQQSIEGLAAGARRAAPVRSTLQKYFVEPATACSASLKLAAVYALEEARPPLAPGIVAANLADRAAIIRCNAYRPALLKRMGQQRSYFEAAVAISRHAGIFTLARTLDFDRLPSLIGTLEDHWRTLGISAPQA